MELKNKQNKIENLNKENNQPQIEEIETNTLNREENLKTRELLLKDLI